MWRGWSAPHHSSAKPLEVNLERVAVSWIDWKVGVRAVAHTTRKNLAGAMNRWFRGLRAHLGLRDDDPVPGSAMTSAHAGGCGGLSYSTPSASVVQSISQKSWYQ